MTETRRPERGTLEAVGTLKDAREKVLQEVRKVIIGQQHVIDPVETDRSGFFIVNALAPRSAGAQAAPDGRTAGVPG